MKLEEKLIKSKELLKFDSFKLIRDTVTMPNGVNKERTYLKHPGGVTILAINDKKDILMVKQYRHPIQKVTLELPAGKTDKDPKETLLQAAKRELKEETGYTAKTFEFLCYTYPSAGIIDQRLALYFAKDLVKGDMNLDDDEFINTTFVPLKEFETLLLRSNITDAKTVTAYTIAKLKKFI